MRKFTLLLSALVLGATAMKAQTVSTFETLSLAHADTFYTNYTAPGTDVGFNSGLAHFPCVYSIQSWGENWDYGFAYSNMTDSVTSGFGNQYSAKPATGYNGSSKYAVCWGVKNVLKLTGTAIGHPVKGFYATNSTYAYNSMRDGDFAGKQFHNGDWFRLTVKGYRGGVLGSDSVGIYLANFLQPDSTNNYILRTWEWVNTESLGKVDSLQFTLASSDVGTFGINTPTYFCIDNFTTFETADTSTAPPPANGVGTTQQAAAKVYPNPATNMLYVDLADNSVTHIVITDITGKEVERIAPASAHVAINTTALHAGMYLLQLQSGDKVATIRFTKE